MFCEGTVIDWMRCYRIDRPSVGLHGPGRQTPKCQDKCFSHTSACFAERKETVVHFLPPQAFYYRSCFAFGARFLFEAGIRVRLANCVPMAVTCNHRWIQAAEGKTLLTLRHSMNGMNWLPISLVIEYKNRSWAYVTKLTCKAVESVV